MGIGHGVCEIYHLGATCKVSNSSGMKHLLSAKLMKTFSKVLISEKGWIVQLLKKSSMCIKKVLVHVTIR